MSPARGGACVVRAPNHLGDLVMALPALSLGAAAVVTDALAPLARIALDIPILGFRRGLRGFADAALELRRYRFARGVLLPPSLSSALLFRAGGVRPLRGLATDGRRALLGDPVPRAAIRGLHRAAAYHYLVTGDLPSEPPRPRVDLPAELRARGTRFVGGGGRRVIGLFPGSNASSRRWSPDRFRDVARTVADGGARVVVFGGPQERGLTAHVAGTAGLDAGGRTDLPLLAAALAACDILITNDSGPAHLAGAVGTPVVSLFGAGNPHESAPLGPAVRVVQRTDLPCVPCVKNVCPRSGRGYLLEHAERECLQLIEVRDVLEAAMPPA